MKTKDVKNMLDILTTEVKINEIDKEFLNNVPKKPMPTEKLRIGRIIVPIILCLFIAFLFIVLMIVSIKSPFFNNPKANPLTNTKRNITYQLVGSLTLLDDIYELNYLENSLDAKVQEEVEKYLTFSNLYLNKETLAIDSLISDDDNYQNKYLIKLNQDVYFYFNETTTEKTDNIDLVSSTIDGYVIFGIDKFLVKGSKDITNDGFKITLRTYYQENSYIEVIQEINNNQTNYSSNFNYYKDGQLEKALSFKFEEHISYDKSEIIVEDKSFEFTKQNDKVIVDVNLPNLYKGKIIIYIKNNEFIYQIAD